MVEKSKKKRQKLRRKTRKNRNKNTRSIRGGSEIEDFKNGIEQILQSIKAKIVEKFNEDPNFSGINNKKYCSELYSNECCKFYARLTESKFTKQDIENLAISKLIADTVSSEPSNKLDNDKLKELFDDAIISLRFLYHDAITSDKSIVKPIIEKQCDDLDQLDVKSPLLSSPVELVRPAIIIPTQLMPLDKMKHFWSNILLNRDTLTSIRQEKLNQTPIIVKELHEYKDEIRKYKNTFKGKRKNNIYEFIRFYSTNYGYVNNGIYYPDFKDRLSIDIFFALSYLSAMLHRSQTCTLLIKGGKAMQFYANIPSNDIDIIIIPHFRGRELTDEDISNIGLNIIQFLLWVTNNNDAIENALLTYIETGTEHSKILKLSCKPNDIGKIVYTPMLDIGLGYNHLPPYIQKIYSTGYKYPKKVSSLFFCSLILEVIVDENLYNILKYISADCDIKNSYYLHKTYDKFYQFLTELINLYGSENIRKLLNDSLKRLKVLDENEYEHIDVILNKLTKGGILRRKWIISIDKDGIEYSEKSYSTLELLCMKNKPTYILDSTKRDSYFSNGVLLPRLLKSQIDVTNKREIGVEPVYYSFDETKLDL